MNNRSSSGGAGILGAILFFAVLFGASKLFPSLGMLLLIAGGIILALIILIVVLVIVFTKSSHKDKPTSEEMRQSNAIISKSRSQLTEIKRTNMGIKNAEIRTRSEEVCKIIDSILRTLKEQPEDYGSMRQFFNYYLPTFGKIVSKYSMLETNNIPTETITSGTVKCLDDIKSAMEKQHANLFENDILDLSVEMEALTLNCKRDGLLADEDFNVG